MKECKSCKRYREDRYKPEIGSCLKAEVGLEKSGFQAAAWNETAWLAVRPDFGCKGWELQPLQIIYTDTKGAKYKVLDTTEEVELPYPVESIERFKMIPSEVIYKQPHDDRFDVGKRLYIAPQFMYLQV